MKRIFILSPAKTTGKRAQLLFSESASFELARRVRRKAGVPLGEVFAFLSGLYFRGKLAYATHFACPPARLPGCYVITSDAGLMPCDALVSLPRLVRFSRSAIDPAELHYRQPLEITTRGVCDRLPPRCDIVLLGSIATGKYLDILHGVFGDRLKFPKDFVGRGDMSRGGLLLRAVEANVELSYVSLAAAESRTGKRPPKLQPIKRRSQFISSGSLPLAGREQPSTGDLKSPARRAVVRRKATGEGGGGRRCRWSVHRRFFTPP